MVNIFKHRCRYKIIGTAFMNDSGVILCDLVCPKCGKTGTVYVNNSWEDEIIEIASKRKYFNLPQYAVLTEREFMNQLAVNDL